MALDAVHAIVTLTSGVQHAIAIAHCVGSQQQAMSDAQLDAKFREQCDPVLGAPRTAAALARWRSIEALADVRACAAACAR